MDEPAVVGSQRRGCRLRASAVSFPGQSSSRARARGTRNSGNVGIDFGIEIAARLLISCSNAFLVTLLIYIIRLFYVFYLFDEDAFL